MRMFSMTKREIYDFFQSTDNKNFYKDWFERVCGEIGKIENRTLKKYEMDLILSTYFNQINVGKN